MPPGDKNWTFSCLFRRAWLPAVRWHLKGRWYILRQLQSERVDGVEALTAESPCVLKRSEDILIRARDRDK